MLKINPNLVSICLAGIALIGMIVLAAIGKLDSTLTGILSGVISAGVWGVVQRQAEPVTKTPTNPDTEMQSP